MVDRSGLVDLRHARLLFILLAKRLPRNDVGPDEAVLVWSGSRNLTKVSFTQVRIGAVDPHYCL